MDDITPTNQQFAAINAVSSWYKNSRKPFFYLAGFAGSGKTTIARMAVAACGLDPDSPRVRYAAYTGKAAMVLRRKGLLATTVHGLIYTITDVQGKERKPVFGLNRDSDLRWSKILVLDECSMISEKVARDLMSFGVKILVLGDPGQLPPISGAGYFTNGTPDFFLTEIHRQALQSSIIRLAHEVRELKDIKHGDYGDVRKVRLEDFGPEDFLAADQVLTGTHNSRHDLNTFLLEADGFPVDLPYQPGIKMLCMRNYHDDGLYNGLIGRTMMHSDPIQINEDERWFEQKVHVEEGADDEFSETGLMRINMGAFEDNWELRDEDVKSNDMKLISRPDWHDPDPHTQQLYWDFGYALTIHKSQGSQWPHVVIFDDNNLHWNRPERAKLMYTAMTRASETLTIVTE